MKRTFKLSALLILAFSVGFYQEKVKISVNYLIEYGSVISGFDTMTATERAQAIDQQRIHAPFDYYHNHSTADWLFRFTIRELTVLKWIITGCSLMVFAFLNLTILKVVQSTFSLTRFLILTYLVLVLFSFGIYAIGIAVHSVEEAYAFSRKIIGALQSIIPAMIIWPAVVLWSSTLKKHQE